GAWMSGQADYAIFLEPEASNLEKSGQGQVVASIGREIGQVDFTSFTATDAYLKKNPKIAQAWTNAILKAQTYVQNDPPATLAQHISSYFPGISEAELVTTNNPYRQYDLWKKAPVVEEAAMEKLQDMLIASGLLEKDNRVKY